MAKKYNFNGEVITLPYTYTNEVGNIVTTSSEEYIYAHGGTDYVEPEPIPKSDEELLAEAKAQKVAEIEMYDTSDAVNGFSYQGQTMWIDKATRVGLVNAVESSILLGKETITFGIGNMSVTMPCSSAKTMLAQLELYALDCYNVTLAHKVAVDALPSLTEVEAYDITSGYPDKLEF